MSKPPVPWAAEEESRLFLEKNVSNPSSTMSIPVHRQQSAPACLVSVERTPSSLPKTQSISKHYALNKSILDAFDSLYIQNKYKVAYAVGMQFVETALLEIPKHGYFLSNQHYPERLQNSSNALRVTTMLEQLVQEEQQEQVHLEQLTRLAQLQQRQDLSSQTLERDLQDVEQQVRYATDHEDYVTENAVLCGNLLLDYSESLSAAICPVLRKQEPKQQDEPEPISERDLQLASDLELGRALSLSGLQVSSTALKPQMDKDSMDIHTLTRLCFEEFRHCQDVQKIRISRMDTYQGRLEGSINGCTVIAPLLCIHHFHNYDASPTAIPQEGLVDEAICQVIDVETPVLLPEIRSKLGLTKDALIIPSDVHDVLMDRQLLCPQQFVTVLGGNVLNAQHLDNFVKSFMTITTKRMAATFFFQEHVICIIKLQRGPNEVWFDVIDSLPFEETMSSNPFLENEQEDVYSSNSSYKSEQREGPEEISSRDASFASSRRSLPLSSSFSVHYEDYYLEQYIPYAARIRCLDATALKSALRWFACSKFTPENKTFMEAYAWDDLNSDFDPRVFQAFVWAEA